MMAGLREEESNARSDAVHIEDDRETLYGSYSQLPSSAIIGLRNAADARTASTAMWLCRLSSTCTPP